MSNDIQADIQAQKAARSAAYRQSQTMRNLVAALLATLAVVIVIVFAVPRGNPPQQDAIDVPALAERVSRSVDHPVLVPGSDVTTQKGWLVNQARLENGNPPVWLIVYAPPEGFLRLEQTLDGDGTRASRILKGTPPSGTTEIAGVTWDEYVIANPAAVDNISYALGVQSGDDHVLLYGSASKQDFAAIATSVSADVQALARR